MSDPPAIDLERTFGYMDVADALRRQQRRVAEHLEISDRDKIKAHLAQRYEAMGHEVDLRLIDQAIDQVLSQANRFKPAAPGFGTRVAGWYVRRNAIARRFGLPLVLLVGLIAIGQVALSGVGSLFEGRQEQAAARVADLRGQAAAIHGNIRGIVVEPAALTRADELLASAERDAEAGREGALRETILALESLQDTLQLEYTIEIVAGVERDSARNYLLVQALGSDGRPVAVQIRNEETGRLERVEEWGERVPREVYDRVARDFEADGLIGDTAFGRKRRGYLTVERDYEDLGQITEW